jgi:pyrroloquinoline quinone biosynthesis protein B
VRVRFLGTAAGGGAPQWNCACDLCRAARSGEGRVPCRTQDCLAVSADGTAWYLLNASPDIRAQLLAAPALAPGPGRRDTPLRGVLLATGELDHTLGLVMLREGSGLRVWAPPPVLAALEADFPLRGVLQPYGGWTWHPAAAGEPFTLDDGRLQVTALPVGTKRPRYAKEPAVDGPWAVAYRIEDTRTGGRLVYAPCLATWPDGFDDVVADADAVIVDGTFWSPDEMTGATGRNALASSQPRMGHLPISGADGSLERLAKHPGVRRFYTHLNNTNPVLAEDSPQRAVLAEAGVEIPPDGTELTL